MAHAVVVGLTDWTSPPPLLTALAATLVFTAVVLGLAPRFGEVTAGWSEPLSVQFEVAGLAFAAILAGVWVIGRIAGTGAEFYSGRPMSTVLLVGLAMLAGERIGAAVAAWLRPTRIGTP